MRITGIKFVTRRAFGLVFPIIRNLYILLFPTCSRIAQLWAMDADCRCHLTESYSQNLPFELDADEGILR
jgi:hypothetical protein